jgi:hypothetical protein
LVTITSIVRNSTTLRSDRKGGDDDTIPFSTSIGCGVVVVVVVVLTGTTGAGAGAGSTTATVFDTSFALLMLCCVCDAPTDDATVVGGEEVLSSTPNHERKSEYPSSSSAGAVDMV